MRISTPALAWLAVTLGVGATPVAAQRETPAEVSVVGRAVSPASIEMGAEAIERLVVTAPEGVRVSVADLAGVATRGVERLGSWRVSRASDGTGNVVWTFSVPFTVWRPGTHRTPTLSIVAEEEGRPRLRVQRDGLDIEVTSPLPRDTRVARPAPPLDPASTPPAWPGLLAVLPAGVAVGSVLAWWTGRRDRPEATSPVVEPPEPSPPSLREVLSAVEGDPAEAALAAAAAARAHPRVVAAGVRGAHTTPEALALAGNVYPELADLLTLADRVAYGGHVPGADEVRAAAGPLAERLADG